MILSRDYGDLGVERDRLGGRSRAEQQPPLFSTIQVWPKDRLIRVPPGVGATICGRFGTEFIPALLALALAGFLFLLEALCARSFLTLQRQYYGSPGRCAAAAIVIE